MQRDGSVAYLSATAQPPYHIVLIEQPEARPKPARTIGLFHVAIRFPNRAELASALLRLIDQGYPLGGFSDHKVSEAIYLNDPDRNGVELYADRPREDWPFQGSDIAMVTDPLDLDDLLAQASPGGNADSKASPGTDIGHIHLQVSDLRKGEAFYRDVLGLDVTQRNYAGALFLSAGGYHHHVGLNIWAGPGAPAPPADAAGLVSYAFQLPDSSNLGDLLDHVRGAGVKVRAQRRYPHVEGVLVLDYDGNHVELLAPRHPAP